MSDILIRGMERPKSCDKCKLCALIPVGMYGLCRKCMPLNRNAKITVRRKDCPLHELPEHGDLIDRDAFREENEYYLHREFINPKYEDTLDDLLKDAPVIVPASKEETE